MVYGSSLLTEIDSTISGLKTKLNTAQRELANVKEKQLQAKRDLSKGYEELAQLYFSTGTSTPYVDKDGIEAWRAEKLQGVSTRISANERAYARAKEIAERDLNAQRDQASVVEQHKAQYEQQLQVNKRYRGLQDDLETSIAQGRIAQHEGEDFTRLHEEFERSSTPLFRDLHKRGYGTKNYRANLFERVVDWFAARSSQVRWQENYPRLALLEQASIDAGESVLAYSHIAQAHAVAIERIEHRTKDETGLASAESTFEALRKTARASTASLDQIAETLETQRNEKKDLLTDEGAWYDRKIQDAAQKLATAGIGKLETLARDTRMKHDDALVENLRNLLEQTQEYDQKIRSLDEKVDDLKRRIREAEESKRHVRRNETYSSVDVGPTTNWSDFTRRINSSNRRADSNRSTDSYDPGGGSFGGGGASSSFGGGGGWSGGGVGRF